MTHERILVQAKVGRPAVFLKMIAGYERLYPDIISPARLGNYIWAWLVNENDWVWLVNEDNWARRLSHCTVGSSLLGPVGWRGWAKAHGTYNLVTTPFFFFGRHITTFGLSSACYDEMFFVVLLQRFICASTIQTSSTNLINQRYQTIVIGILKN